MIDPLWSWVLTAWTVAGMWGAGSTRYRVQGWIICCLGEVLWAMYASQTQQWGFLVGAVIFGGVYGLNIGRAVRHRAP